MELTWPVYGLLWCAAFLAGFVDSIAGGGGIITLPVLLACGFDPHLALGTNKLQASFGSCTAAVHYAHKGLSDFRRTLLGILFTAIGALVGTAAIQQIDAAFLVKLIPIFLTVLFFYLLFSPDIGRLDRHPVIAASTFYAIFGLGLGFYDGFFGPGTGSFWMLVFVVFLGQNLKAATAHTKIMNAASNLISLAVFLVLGNVLILPGLLMGSGQLLGAALGSHVVIHRGTGFVRFFFLSVVALTIARLIYSTYFS
ncbi:MAG: TSUP family transporter [Planctomycetales bacterium]|nr:TSUP family transporter [Planctomycetales bacterium]